MLDKDTKNETEYSFRSCLNVVLAERRMTKVELAKRLGVRPETITRWANDEEMLSMTVSRLIEVADALGTDPKSLFEK